MFDIDRQNLVPAAPRTVYKTYYELKGVNSDFFKKRMNGEFLPPITYYFGGQYGNCNIVNIPGSSLKYSDLDTAPFSARAFIDGGVPLGIDSAQWQPYGVNHLERMHLLIKNGLSGKVRSADVNLPVALAEMPKTMSMVGRAAETIAKSFGQLIRGMPTAAVNTLLFGVSPTNGAVPAHLASRWLEWSYGVKPLIKDVEGAALAAAKATEDEEGKLVHVSMRLKDRLVGSAKTPKAPLQGQRFVSYSGSGLIVGRGDVWAKIANPMTRNLHECGFTNPALVAWELIPYSFVVDWFIPIGNWLNGFTPVTGLTFLGGCTYVKFGGNFKRGSGNHNEYLSQTQGRLIVKDRRILSSFPTFTIPPLDFSLSANQLANGLALLMAPLTGKSRS